MFYFKCEKCQSEWNGIKRLEICPFCGFAFPVKASDFTDIDEAFNYIFGKYGFEIIRQNHKLVSLLADYAPSLENERRLVRMALDAGIYTDLLVVNADDNAAQDEAKAKAINKLNKLYFLDPIWATKVVSWLIVQLAWSSDLGEKTTILKSSDKDTILKSQISVAPAVARKVNTGEIILFGSYPQEDPKKKDAIEWEVISVSADRALLLSKYCLDTKWYNNSKWSTTWGNCALRDWLNKEFLNTAFSDSERVSIIETESAKSCNPRSNAVSGGPSKDKVFILSCEDIKQYNLELSQMQSKATLLAKGNGVYYDTENDFAAWWLRTPGYTNESAMYVMRSGKTDELGDKVDSRNKGVRPAIWVDLKTI